MAHERDGVAPGRFCFPSTISSWPARVRVESTNSWLGLDRDVYVEVDFFGEEDTRSCRIRMVTDPFTKIINVPNMKDHGASGVTGCLKNVAYGEFNVARSHSPQKVIRVPRRSVRGSLQAPGLP